ATNLEILKAQLELLNLEVITALSGEAALDILEKNVNFQLVIADMQMPEMDGIKLTENIKKMLPAVPVILLSSAGNETKAKYPHLFNSVLTKPVKQQYLYKMVQAELDQTIEAYQEVGKD